MKKIAKRNIALLLSLFITLGMISGVAWGDDSAYLVEANLVTEVLDWGETITAVRLEYSEEIACDAIEYSTEYSETVTYDMVSDRDIVNLYVNNSGKKDDVQLKGKYVFINLGTVNEDFTTYRDQVAFDTGSRSRPTLNPYYLYQSAPITTIAGNVIPRQAITTKGVVREVIDDFETFTYTNEDTGNFLNYHLYIPEGYDTNDSSLEDIPIIVHFPSNDYMYEDGGDYLGALFSHPDCTVWASEEAQAQNKAFVVTVGGPRTSWYASNPPSYDDSEMMQNYMAILQLLLGEYNIDTSRIYAISLAGGSQPMWTTMLANPDLFAAQITTAYEPYEAYLDQELAESNLSTIMDEIPGWFFAGYTDRSGMQKISDDDFRVKGERWIDFADRMIAAGYNFDVAYGDEGELMWNGMLRGEDAEALAQEQLDRAAESGANQLVTLYIPGTVLQTMHWSWNATYSNAVVRNWLFSQTKGDHISGTGGTGIDVESRYVTEAEATGETASLVEAKLYTQVLDWGETVTAVRLEYSEEISCRAIEHSTEYAETRTYKMLTNRDIVNLYVNNSGKRDDIEISGKYVFINLGTVCQDPTSYRDQVTFLTSANTRPTLNAYYLYQSVPIITVSGKTIEGGPINTSGEVREDIDKFETFTYTNEETGNFLNYHLYIPEGYEAKSDSLDDLPIIVHFPSLDFNYEDDGRYLGALFTHTDCTVWASDEAQANNKAFVVTVGGPSSPWYPNVSYEDSEMMQNYVKIIQLLLNGYNIDNSRIYGVSLAGGAQPMWNIILEYPGMFAAQMTTGFDPYVAFSDEELAEESVGKIMDEMPSWYFMGYNDRPGAARINAGETRYKGQIMIDFCENLIGKGYNIDIGYGEEGELMWNGLLRGSAADALAQEQLSRAEAYGAEHMLTLFTPGTLLQSMHWPWTAAYTNSVVRDWVFEQVNANPSMSAQSDDVVDPDDPTTDDPSPDDPSSDDPASDNPASDTSSDSGTSSTIDSNTSTGTTDTSKTSTSNSTAPKTGDASVTTPIILFGLGIVTFIIIIRRKQISK